MGKPGRNAQLEDGQLVVNDNGEASIHLGDHNEALPVTGLTGPSGEEVHPAELAVFDGGNVSAQVDSETVQRLLSEDGEGHPDDADMTIAEEDELPGDPRPAVHDHGENNNTDGHEPVISDLQERDYQHRLKPKDSAEFKAQFGVTVESISERVGVLLDEEIHGSEVKFENYSRWANNDVRNLFYKLEFAQSGIETYLRELQDRAKESGGDDSDAARMLRHLEKSGLYEQLTAIRGYTRELRLCYENGCSLKDEYQARRIFKKHLYRAHGIYISAAPDQEDQIAKLKKNAKDEAQLKRIEAIEEKGASFHRTAGLDKSLVEWSSAILPKNAYTSRAPVRRAAGKTLRAMLSLGTLSVAPRVIPKLGSGLMRDMWNDDPNASFTVAGFKRPPESAHRYQGSRWSFKWCSDYLFPAPSIKLTGNNTGSIKIPRVGKEALVWAMNNPKAEKKKWYRDARTCCMDFVDALVECGRARTPTDAFSFNGDESLQSLMMLSVKMRAIHTNEVFYIKDKNGQAVRVGPEPLDNLQAGTPEYELFKPIMDRPIHEHDEAAMSTHYGALRNEFLGNGKNQTKELLEKKGFARFSDDDIKNQETASLSAANNAQDNEPSKKRRRLN